MSDFHTSVLLTETINLLNVRKDKNYIDATLGGGGHTFEILKHGGNVLGLDVDQEAIDFVRSKNQDSGFKNRLIIAKGNFRDIERLSRENKFENVSGIIFDLGVSSHQLDSVGRGFSFRYDALLDMRMDKELQIKAMDLLRVLTKGELYELFYKYGEDRFAKRVASNIVESRRIKPIESTVDLINIVEKSIPRLNYQIHPATRIFQALRIAVNDELQSLEEGLEGAYKVVTDDGVIVIISFHSLEDRMVKHTFKKWEEAGLGINLTKKPILPSETEIRNNSRSRSAKLRGFKIHRDL